MKVQIFVSHPDVNNSVTQQFFKSSLKLSTASVEVTVLDNELNASGQFNVKDHQEKILEADHIIFQFPLYWYLAPFSLKKWQDDIFTNQFVNQLKNVNQFKQKSLSLVVNTGQPKKGFKVGQKTGYSLDEIFRPYQVFANELGFNYLSPFVVYQFAYLNEQQQYQLLVDYLMHVDMLKASFADKGNYLISQIESQFDFQENVHMQAVIETIKSQIMDYQDLRQALDEVKDNEE